MQKAKDGGTIAGRTPNKMIEGDCPQIEPKYGRLLVKDCMVVKPSAHSKVYEGCGTVEWRDMMYINYASTDECPGALKFDKSLMDNGKVDKLLVE